MYKGYYKWDLTKEWFQMSNDNVYNKYGFNFNPHKYGDLYIDVRNALEEEVSHQSLQPSLSVSIGGIPVNTKDIEKSIAEGIAKQLSRTAFKSNY